MRIEYLGEWRSEVRADQLCPAAICGKVVASKQQPSAAVSSCTHSSWGFFVCLLLTKPRKECFCPLQQKSQASSCSYATVRHLFTLEWTGREARLVRTNVLSFLWTVSQFLVIYSSPTIHMTEWLGMKSVQSFQLIANLHDFPGKENKINTMF